MRPLPGVLRLDDLLSTALEMAAAMTRFGPYGLEMTKSILWVNLGNPSLESAIEIEDHDQLMLCLPSSSSNVPASRLSVSVITL